MKWTILRGASRRQAIDQVLSDREGATLDFKVRGNAVWTIKRTASEPSIVLFQLRHRGGYGWGYRRIPESHPPLFHGCPLRFLDRTPVVSAHWRQSVLVHHARWAKTPEAIEKFTQTACVPAAPALLQRLVRRTKAEIRGVTEMFNMPLRPDARSDSAWEKTQRELLRDLYADLNELQYCLAGATPATRIVSYHGAFPADWRAGLSLTSYALI